MLRQVLSLFLSILIAFAPLASHAKSSAAVARERGLDIIRQFNFKQTPRPFQMARSLGLSGKQVSEGLEKLAASKPAQMSAHFGQTLLFLLSLTVLEVARTELAATGLNPSDKSSLQALQDFVETATPQVIAAATVVLDNGGTYLSIAGAGATTAAAKYPVDALTALLADPTTRPLINQTVRAGAMTIAGTFGWDAAGQLWTDASYLLDTTEEFQRSQSLWRTSKGALKALLFSSTVAADQKDLQLLEKMGSNLKRIIWLDQDLRAEWLDRTVRTRMWTGEAFVLNAALTAAVAGNMVLPGGGWVMGFALGVGAAFIAINIPQEVKDSITGALHTPRLRVQQGRMGTREIEMRSLIHSGGPLYRAQEILGSRRKIRSGYLTIRIEQVRLVLKATKGEHGSSKLSSVAARQRLAQIFGEMNDFFTLEARTWDRLANYAQSSTPHLLRPLDDEKARAGKLAEFFAVIGGELERVLLEQGEGEVQLTKLTGDDREIVNFIELGYLRGFNEDKI